MAAILFARIRSGLDAQESGVAWPNGASFPRAPGLIRKIYGRDNATGDVCGIYFESDETLAAFRETELARTLERVEDALVGVNAHRT